MAQENTHIFFCSSAFLLFPVNFFLFILFLFVFFVFHFFLLCSFPFFVQPRSDPLRRRFPTSSLEILHLYSTKHTRTHTHTNTHAVHHLLAKTSLLWRPQYPWGNQSSSTVVTGVLPQKHPLMQVRLMHSSSRQIFFLSRNFPGGMLLPSSDFVSALSFTMVDLVDMPS